MKKVSYIDNDGKRAFVTINDLGMVIHETKIAADVKKMISPVICNHCGQAYDLADAKVIHNYADCTDYITPCCNTRADDREWKSFPDFKRINLNEYQSS